MELPDLENLPPEQVDAAHAYLSQRLAEYAPTAEQRRGVIHDIVLYLEGVFAAAADEWADRIRKSGTLKAIQEDPTLATDEIVDGVLSNFGAERKPGSPATGRVVIQIGTLTPSNVASGTVFVALGQTFVTEQAFAGRISQAAVVNPTDRLIRPLGDGTYAYVIDVVAADEGTAGMIRRGTRLEPQTLIPGLVAAYAESDFVGGLNPESNAELVARQREGIAGKNPSNRTTLAAMIRQEEQFARVVGLSAVGFGDPEQLRYHSIFPVAFGGRLDVYARTQALPQTVRLEVTATLVQQTAAGGVWQFGLGRDDAPGFYDVVQVVPFGANEQARTGYEVTSLERQLDLTDPGDFAPDLTTAAEAAFTRYQAGVVQFLDTDTNGSTAVGTEAVYVAFVRAVPLVAELQAFLDDRDRRPGAGDVVVKAPVPCDVRLTFTVFKQTGQADPDTAAMAAALADEVNRSGFPTRLPASTLQAVAHRFLASGQSTGALDLWGRITLPGSQTPRYLRSPAALEVPDLPAQGVTGRTVAFYLDPSDVSISVTVKDVPAI